MLKFISDFSWRRVSKTAVREEVADRTQGLIGHQAWWRRFDRAIGLRVVRLFRQRKTVIISLKMQEVTADGFRFF